jgi:predicted metalloprotease
LEKPGNRGHGHPNRENAMRLDDMQESRNVEDRRGGGGRRVAFGGGLGTLILVVAYILMGGDPSNLLQTADPGTGVPGREASVSPEDEALKTRVSKVLKSTEVVWQKEFSALGRRYPEPTLTLFSGGVRSGCGLADAGMGPFYCPSDQRIYIDLSFYRELNQRFGAPGDFAQAYVIAHEVGHHVQHALGLSRPLEEARARGSDERELNSLSVRLELQADFLAGVWARKQEEARPFLDPGDIEEAMRCAEVIGDDALQKRAQGYVVPDSFTHGTSAQRVRWFMKGYQTGDVRQGDTFRTKDL